MYLAARNEQKALKALESLKAENIAPGHVVWLPLNLADPRQTKKAAEEFMTKEMRLDVLSEF